MTGVPQPPTGHVYRVERARGPVWYAKYRLPDRRQVQKKIEPAWLAAQAHSVGINLEKRGSGSPGSERRAQRCRSAGEVLQRSR